MDSSLSIFSKALHMEYTTHFPSAENHSHSLLQEPPLIGHFVCILFTKHLSKKFLKTPYSRREKLYASYV